MRVVFGVRVALVNSIFIWQTLSIWDRLAFGNYFNGMDCEAVGPAVFAKLTLFSSLDLMTFENSRQL
jgi:hypothetical protein